MSSLLQQAEVEVSRMPEAAWIIDLARSRIMAASRAGCAAWNGAWRPGAGLDCAMPSLAVLSQLASDRPAGAEERVSLSIWTTSPGLVRLTCRCRVLAGPEACVLVIAEGETASAPTDQQISPVVTDDQGRATLAHELRTPLSAIVALAEVMKEERFGPMGNARYLAYANDIYESAGHALSVIGAMLEEGGNATPELAETDVDATVTRCLSALRELAEKASVRLLADLGPGRLHLAIERRSLMQILLNLISNALKATPAGGMVTIATRRARDGGLVLSVNDTGAGMSPDQLARVRAGAPASARAGRRRGYGLPLVKRLAEASDARLDIGSAPGQGTRISITFPADRIVETGPA